MAGSENSGHNGETGNLADDHAGLPAGSVTKHRARSVRAVMTLRLQGQTLVAGPKVASRNAGIPCCVWPAISGDCAGSPRFMDFSRTPLPLPRPPRTFRAGPRPGRVGPCVWRGALTGACRRRSPTARAKPHPARISDQLEGRTSPSASTSPQMRRKSSRKRAGKNSGIGRFAVMLTRRSISSAG